MSICVHLAGLNFAIASVTDFLNFSASELRITWDLRWYEFYGLIPYKSKDSH